jgi:hypothetical protein
MLAKQKKNAKHAKHRKKTQMFPIWYRRHRAAFGDHQHARLCRTPGLGRTVAGQR